MRVRDFVELIDDDALGGERGEEKGAGVAGLGLGLGVRRKG